MKSIYSKYLKSTICLVAACVLATGCSDEYEYTTDYSSYDNVTLKVALTDENNVLDLKIENKTHAVIINVTPEDKFIDKQAYIYTLSDETVATISEDGTLTMLKEGETELNVQFRGNKKIATSCTVRISRTPIYVTDVKVPENVSVQIGKELNLAEQISVLPASADNPKLKYASDNEAVVSVSEEGIIKGVSEGTATITVSTTDGSGITKTCTVKSSDNIFVSEINVDELAGRLNGKKLSAGQSYNLASFISVAPENATNKEVTYTVTEGQGVVSVSEDGVLEALSSGTAKIRIEAADGSQVAQEVAVEVEAAGSMFNRTLWKVDTSIRYSNNGLNYVPDDAGIGTPESLTDGNNATFLSLVKPGKTYNGSQAGDVNTPLFFVVDMGVVEEFDCFYWRHRNTTAGFQAVEVAMFGSVDGEAYEEIVSGLELPGGSTVESTLDLPKACKYRYIKVQYLKWNTANSCIQVAEFNVGKK